MPNLQLILFVIEYITRQDRTCHDVIYDISQYNFMQYNTIYIIFTLPLSLKPRLNSVFDKQNS